MLAMLENRSLTEGRQILIQYLSEVRDIRNSGAGVAETSYYGALANLFNAVGNSLKPKVRCILTLNNQGAGLPDGGLFTPDQFEKKTAATPKQGQIPSRGAIEVKGSQPDVRNIANTAQVRNYLARYSIVIVTNLRSFVIVDKGPGGVPTAREAFHIAPDEQSFWQDAAAHPHATANRMGSSFFEFIKRACLQQVPLTNPKDVAWFLASYARDALSRVEAHKDLPALAGVRIALEEALGMKFLGDKGEHFFRSTLVQTLFYGVFSAWVHWHKDGPATDARFDWRNAEWSLHVPFIRALYEEVSKPSRLGPLNLVEVLDWSAGVLNRVERADFFTNFEDEYAVQYFYEPFLEAYDPDLRKELGVWYTPPEIVKYQVARVDTVLREELELPDGLADPNVVVLDPCCGTGAYLVEVLHKIAETLRDKGGDALVASDLKQAAMHRIFGFEIMPAPFVVAHLQLASLLQNTGAPLAHGHSERVGVYLTNALTGWEPPKETHKQQIAHFQELEQERDAAEKIKRGKKILVVLGNPPYNAFAGVSPQEEQGLVDVYKKNLNKPVKDGGWGIKKFNLDELYVRFFRLAERRIADMSGRGVVSYISNFSYLSDPSFVVMRQRYLSEFDKLWFDCMNGDSRETGKRTAEGEPDPSVFSTDYNREGIRVGTAVSVIVRKPTREKQPTVYFRHYWGTTKRADLLASIETEKFNDAYDIANPSQANRFSFRPEEVAAHYTEWPKLVELCAEAPSNGLMEKRGGSLISIDKDDLAMQMRDYFDRQISWDNYKREHRALTANASRFDAKKTRDKVLGAFEPRDGEKSVRGREEFSAARLVRYAVRPYDTRWCYYTSVRPIWNEPRPKLWKQRFKGNRFLISRPAGVADPEGAPISFFIGLGDNDYQRGHSYYFPIYVEKRVSHDETDDMFDSNSPSANLAAQARNYFTSLGIIDPDSKPATASLIWMHALAIGYSPAYLTENADGIRRDWPRIPLPSSRSALQDSAALGEQVAALLDTEAEVPGVTTGSIPPFFKKVGCITKVGGGSIDPSSRELAITAGWGHYGKDNVVMPARGRIVRRKFIAEELEALEAEASARASSLDELVNLLGEETCDVYLNEDVYWQNVPVAVYDYIIGGYQVIKKWLSYREEEILKRPLKPDEAREVMNIARRITGIVLLQPELDSNYNAIKQASFDWKELNQAEALT